MGRTVAGSAGRWFLPGSAPVTTWRGKRLAYVAPRNVLPAPSATRRLIAGFARQRRDIPSARHG